MQKQIMAILASVFLHLFLFQLLFLLTFIPNFKTNLILVKDIIPIRLIVRDTKTTPNLSQNKEQKDTDAGFLEKENVLISNPHNSESSLMADKNVHVESNGAEIFQPVVVKYPQLSRLNHEEGTVYIIVKQDGAELVRTSGYDRLDKEALSAIQQLILQNRAKPQQKFKIDFKLE